MMREDFAVFILSHGRAKEITTAKMLSDGKYTGDWFVVIDNEDDQEDIYREKFGEHVIQFDKIEEANRTDTGDLDNDRRVGVFARNAIQRIASQKGYKYHLQLDDDFTGLDIRKVTKGKLKAYKINDIDRALSCMLDFMDNTDVKWISFGLSSDYLGGAQNPRYQKGLLPKTMGSFLLRNDCPANFVMRMNDDITTCILNWSRGCPNYTVTHIQVETPPTQSCKGGMTEIYKDNGTYRKSFYSVMNCPSFVTVSKQGITNFRIHHYISWNNCVPMVLNEKYRKSEDYEQT